jgi:hypothetical protein
MKGSLAWALPVVRYVYLHTGNLPASPLCRRARLFRGAASDNLEAIGRGPLLASRDLAVRFRIQGSSAVTADLFRKMEQIPICCSWQA